MECSILLGRLCSGGGLAAPPLAMPKRRSIVEAPAKDASFSAEGFASLLAKLGDTPREAGERYERLRSKLIFFFARRQLPLPEDLADDAMDCLGRRLSEGLDISSVDAFALGIARHIAQEQVTIANQTRTVDTAFFDDIPAFSLTSSEKERIVNLDQRIEAFERCMRRLPSREIQLLKSYYLDSPGDRVSVRLSLAKRMAISQGTLRQRVFLIRRSLVECVTVSLQKKGHWRHRSDSAETL